MVYHKYISILVVNKCCEICTRDTITRSTSVFKKQLQLRFRTRHKRQHLSFWMKVCDLDYPAAHSRA